MSTLKKERVIFITGIALFVLTMMALCFPFFTVGVYTNTQDANTAESIRYLGWQIFKFVNPLIKQKYNENDPDSPIINLVMSPIGSEAAFTVFSAVLVILACLVGVLCGYGLYKSIKTGKGIGKKWINIVFVGYFVFSVVMLALYFTYIHNLNTMEFVGNKAANLAKRWSIFGFKSMTGVEALMGPAPFILTAIGTGAMMTSIIFTMGIQDNSILYPYKKRQVYSSLLTIALCVGIFFLPFIDFFYSTEYLSYTENFSSISAILFRKGQDNVNQLTVNGLENIALNFTNGVGWDMISTGSGAIQGYYKVLFVMMFTVAGCGIVYAVANLLGACEVIRFNFSRKHLNTVCLVIMVIGIMLWFGSFAYMLGVNVRLNDFYGQYQEVFVIAYPDGEFPQTSCTLGAWLSMVPGIIGYAGVAWLNAFED